MKKVIFLFLGLFAVTAFAKDEKLGNVIAVERTISDVYNRCLTSVDKPGTGPQYFYSCAFRYLNLGELAITQGRAFSFTKDGCQVYAELVNGNVFITFATDRNSSTFEDSKACLAKSLEGQKTVKAIIYTVQ